MADTQAPPSKRPKAAVAEEMFEKGEQTILAEVLPLIMDYISCFDLSTAAAVAKNWRRAASDSYFRRINTPWEILSADTVLYHPKSDKATSDSITGYKQQRKRQTVKWTEKVMYSQKLYCIEEKDDKTEWRLRTKAELQLNYDGKNPLVPGYFAGERTYVDPLIAGILRQLPLEKDLPETLLSKTHTKFQSCSIDKKGLLLLIFARSWTPDYSDTIKQMGLEDRYEHCVHRWRILTEERGDDFDEIELYEEEEEANRPGCDIWGMLYHVESAASKGEPPFRLVDAKRLASEDFPYFFFGYMLRSQNGKVGCMKNGVAQNLQQDRNTCTPTIRTFILDKEKGIDCSHAKQPIELPVPCGLEDTYSSRMMLSPAGDYLFTTYGDKGDIDGIAFYKYDTNTKAWEKLWEEEGDDCITGYFTPDSDFCITENGNGVTIMPGAMAKGRILFLDPMDYWYEKSKETT